MVRKKLGVPFEGRYERQEFIQTDAQSAGRTTGAATRSKNALWDFFRSAPTVLLHFVRPTGR